MEAHEIRQWLEKNRLMKLFESMQALGIKGIVDLLALKEEDVNILKQRLLKIEIIRFVRALNELKNVGSQPSPPKGARTPRPGAPRSGGPRRRVSAKTPSIFAMHEDNVTPAEDYLQLLFTDILTSLEDDDQSLLPEQTQELDAETERKKTEEVGAGRSTKESTVRNLEGKLQDDGKEYVTIKTWLEKHQLQAMSEQLADIGAEFTSDLLCLEAADLTALQHGISEPEVRDRFITALSGLKTTLMSAISISLLT
jgi:hypothetical protein